MNRAERRNLWRSEGTPLPWPQWSEREKTEREAMAREIAGVMRDVREATDEDVSGARPEDGSDEDGADTGGEPA